MRWRAVPDGPVLTESDVHALRALAAEVRDKYPPAYDEQEIRDLVAFVASLGDGPANPSPQVDEVLLPRGQQLFAANCAPCHGATGKGDGTAAASLDPKPRDHSNRAYMDTLTDESIAEVVKVGGALRGFPNMPSHPHIGGEDMVALVAYVRTLSRGPDGVQVVALDVD